MADRKDKAVADTPDWRDTFCGRERELAQLVALYNEVASGCGPRLAVVLGDRGMGKTRLVQELYRVLTREHDPLNYWPDASLFNGNNLRVAPDLADPAVREHYESFRLEERPMPFLWWGFRLSDPDARNAARSDMAAHRATLDPHLAPVFFARRAAAARSRLLEAGKDVGTEFGKTLLVEAVKAIPGVGVGVRAFELFIQYMDKGKLAIDAIREERELQAKSRAEDLLQAHSELFDDIHDRTLADLTELLAPASDLRPLPTVVFVDDAQFACSGGDEGALRLLEDLWLRAHLAGWPVLLVLTHWGVEWLHAAADPAVPSCARVFRHSAASAQFCRLIDLPKEPGLAALVRAGLPASPAEDVQLLVDRADGNPQVLIELIELVRRKPAWRDRNGGRLTTHARREIEQRSTSLSALILERLESDITPEPVRQAVALSSVQGMEFLCRLTIAAAEALKIEESANGLRNAQQPHRLVAGVEEGVAGFVQRAYRDAARALIDGHVDDAAEVERVLLKAAVSIYESDRWSNLSAVEQRTALSVLVELAEDQAEPAMRRYAGKALLVQIGQALGGANGQDYARAAELALRFEAGLAAKRWSVTDFKLYELDEARVAVSVWHGPARTAALAQAMLLLSCERAKQLRTPSARRNVSFLLDTVGQVAEEQGRWSDAEVLYRENLQFRRELAAQGTPETRREVAFSSNRVGWVAQAQGQLAEAEQLYRESLQICRELAAQGTPEARHDVSVALDQVARAARVQGRWTEAGDLYRESLLIRRELAAQSRTPEAWRGVLVSLGNISEVAQAQGQWAEADKLYRASLQICNKLAAQPHTHEDQRHLSVAFDRVGWAAQAQGKWVEADRLHRKSLQIRRELAEKLGTPAARRDVSVSLDCVGWVAYSQGQWSEADELYRQSLQIRRQLAVQLTTPAARGEVAAAIDRVGWVAEAQGQWTKAEKLYRESLEVRRELAAQGIPGAQRDVTFSLVYLGRVAQEQGRSAEAEALYRESLQLRRALAAQGTPSAQHDMSVSLNDVGQVAQAQGRWAEAEKLYRESLGIRRDLAEQLGTPAARGEVASSLNYVGQMVQAQGRWTEAEQLYREGLGIRRELAAQLGTPGARRDVSVSLNNVGAATQAQGQWIEAEKLYRECLAIRRELAEQLGTPAARGDVGLLLNRVGLVAQAQGQWTEAEKLYRECLQVCRELAAQGVPGAQRDVSISLDNVGQMAQVLGNLPMAESLYRESLEIRRELAAQKGTPQARREVGVSLLHLAALAREASDMASSCNHLREALPLFEAVAQIGQTPQSLREVEAIRSQLAQDEKLLAPASPAPGRL